VIGTIISGYRIVRQVGKGGMGVVYQAVNEQIARTTAIKVLSPRYCQDPETVQRLMNEARAVNIVGHPGLISIHEFGQLEDGSGYLIMEFLDGDTLRARLKSQGGRWWPGGVRIAQQIASTLAATHEYGIVHRDLKPENIMLVADPLVAGGERAKILDFGVAKISALPEQLATPGGAAVLQTATNAVIGTPLYMSPEQCRGVGKVDAKADVYSFGVILYEMIAGAVPFQGEPWQLPVLHIAKPPRSLATHDAALDPRIGALVDQMLAKDPAARPTMAEIAATLDQLSEVLLASNATSPAGGAAWIVPPVTLDTLGGQSAVDFAGSTAGLSQTFSAAQSVGQATPGLAPRGAVGNVETPASLPPSGGVVIAALQTTKAQKGRRYPALLAGALGLATLLALSRLWVSSPGKPPASAALTQSQTRPATMASPRSEPSSVVDLDDPKLLWHVPVDGSPSRGAKKALVTIVEFAEYQCRRSKSAEKLLQHVAETYGDDVRVVWKESPLAVHRLAEPAAWLARYALKEKGGPVFWQLHDRLFAEQNRLSPALFRELAQGAGLDPDGAMSAIDKRLFEDQVDADIDLADRLDVRSTPTLFVNGRRINGLLPFAELKALIDAELARARAKLAQGVAPEALYEALVGEGLTAIPVQIVDLAPPKYMSPTRGGGAECVVPIYQFCDFESFFCPALQPMLEQLLAAYGERVQLLWRHHPDVSSPNAALAAEAVQEAMEQRGQQGFVEMQKQLFEHQDDPGFQKQAALERYARHVGLNRQKFKRALAQHSHAAHIQQDLKDAAAAQVTEVPAFVVGRYRVNGTITLRMLKRLTDRSLAESCGPGSR